MVAFPAAPPSHPTSSLPTRWIAQRLWIGPFLVPDRPFLIHPPCLVCRGAIFHDDGVFRCLHCGREHLITAIRHDGRATGLELQDSRDRPSGRQLPSAYRDARARSKQEGITGFQARVFKLVPRTRGSQVVVESLVHHLGVSRGQVRSALDALTGLGLLEQVVYAGGYRAAWRRLSTEEP